MANIIGQTLLDQFRVDEFIASGGMGAVYKVWDLKRNVALAMKVLHADFVDDPSAFKYFQREARALQKLAHPNIVPFYGLVQTDGITFILEQYIDGPSLREVLNKNLSGLPLSEALIYMKALCSALGYAHANEVIHCDIKPANVMMDSGGKIFLADFGIARHAQSVTTTIASAGTPAYMSPEQIRAGQVFPATDVYALGVLLFEMLTGQRPFRGDEPELINKGGAPGERVRYAQLNSQPPNPSSINPFITREAAAVILRALRKLPSERYQSVSEFLQALCMAAGVSLDRIPVRVKPQKNASQAYSGPPNNPPPKPVINIPPKPRIQKSFPLLWIILGIACLLIFGILATSMFSIPGGDPIYIPTDNAVTSTRTEPLFTPTINIIPPVTDTAAPTETPTSTVVVPPTLTNTPPAPTKTPITFCTGAPPQRVTVGDKIKVCTNSGDSLFVRNKPGLNGKPSILVKDYEMLFIVGGPRCLDDASWWKVTVPIGTSAIWADTGNSFITTEEMTGWVREGDYHDPKNDLYFICREP